MYCMVNDGECRKSFHKWAIPSVLGGKSLGIQNPYYWVDDFFFEIMGLSTLDSLLNQPLWSELPRQKLPLWKQNVECKEHTCHGKLNADSKTISGSFPVIPRVHPKEKFTFPTFFPSTNCRRPNEQFNPTFPAESQLSIPWTEDHGDVQETSDLNGSHLTTEPTTMAVIYPRNSWSNQRISSPQKKVDLQLIIQKEMFLWNTKFLPLPQMWHTALVCLP